MIIPSALNFARVFFKIFYFFLGAAAGGKSLIEIIWDFLKKMGILGVGLGAQPLFLGC